MDHSGVGAASCAQGFAYMIDADLQNRFVFIIQLFVHFRVWLERLPYNPDAWDSRWNLSSSSGTSLFRILQSACVR